MDRRNFLGIDIGGTKTAILYAKENIDHSISIIQKLTFKTSKVQETIDNIFSHLDEIICKNKLAYEDISAIGISCGGPLDSKKGIIMSPPNLPDWKNILIVDMIKNKFGIPCAIQNDANACALAEWKYGAGIGSKNMIFLTFGTGLGAGLILNGELYSGANDNAGEVGHIRLADFGPVGYGKQGSFEGFASGGGIAQIARTKLLELYQQGGSVNWCSFDEIECVSAQIVAEQANKRDQLANDIIRMSAVYLGKGLSILIDILNPECIVIGSIYARNVNLFNPVIEEIVKKEALSQSLKVCQIKPAQLGENIGDYAAISIACNLVNNEVYV
jgi:glucokinase